MKELLGISVVIMLMILAQSCKKDDEKVFAVTDIDGNDYTSVTIGTQVWLAENLKTTRYRNGDLIGTTIPATLDITEESTPKYQWAYDGDESNVETYGRLYTWDAVNDSRMICPTGWHASSGAEWETLIIYLGKFYAASMLKEKGTSHWEYPNTGATNKTGFTALPGGGRRTSGLFFAKGTTGYWWNSSIYIYPLNFYRSMTNTSQSAGKGDTWTSVKNGFSVRCIKD